MKCFCKVCEVEFETNDDAITHILSEHEDMIQDYFYEKYFDEVVDEVFDSLIRNKEEVK